MPAHLFEKVSLKQRYWYLDTGKWQDVFANFARQLYTTCKVLFSGS